MRPTKPTKRRLERLQSMADGRPVKEWLLDLLNSHVTAAAVADYLNDAMLAQEYPDPKDRSERHVRYTRPAIHYEQSESAQSIINRSKEAEVEHWYLIPKVLLTTPQLLVVMKHLGISKKSTFSGQQEESCQGS